MKLEKQLRRDAAEAINQLYNVKLEMASFTINETQHNFVGDFSLVCFPLARYSKKGPEDTAAEIGDHLQKKSDYIFGFNVQKGFLNLQIENDYWISYFDSIKDNKDFAKPKTTGKKVVLECCGPNTNKPLHLGHLRNMFVGFSTASILSYAGDEVHKVNIYNDRGIAICKSMLAWQKFGNEATPKSEGIKGDHFVGKYYVKFDEGYKEEVERLIQEGKTEEQAKREAPIIQEAQKMLLAWEAGDEETVALWEQMNAWVYEGFEQTFKTIGVDFEKHYKESEYYKAGKKLVEEGLQNEVFYKKPDGSVWVDLEDKGLDHKLLLRANGTSVYITQDMGIAQARFDDYRMDRSVYVVANEQDYHFKVLQLAMQKLEKQYADGIYHLSYGMVDLPTGRMKSREGTVVDADDLVQEVYEQAKAKTLELGKLGGMDEADKDKLYMQIALAAIKYFILKVNPKKRMIFNPEESIDIQGNTGPFIQYSYARIQSIIRRFESWEVKENGHLTLSNEGKELIKHLARFEDNIQQAAEHADPSIIANYVYQLAKTYNRFFAEQQIFDSENGTQTTFRVNLSNFCGKQIFACASMLGFELPNQM